jgi:hypothetical protein
MASINTQQRYEIFVETQDAPTASNDPTQTARVINISEGLVQEQIQARLPYYIPPIEVPYRPFSLSRSSRGSISPVALFLLFFGRVINLLLHHTNIALQGQQWKGNAVKPLLEIEIRRWLACRIEMAKYGPSKASFRHFWSSERPSSKTLSQNRFLAIEHFICLSNQVGEPSKGLPWYWKVQDGLNSVKEAF